MDINTILEKYKDCPLYNKIREINACKGDVIDLCNIGADFARSNMFKEAVACWEYIVSNGYDSIEAYVNLGVSYHYGNGVEVNYEKAVHYYQIAAVRGHPFGQYNFAVACEYGKGTPYDINKAIYYYRKAAEQGINMAIEALIRLGLYDELYIQFYRRNLNDGSFTPNT